MGMWQNLTEARHSPSRAVYATYIPGKAVQLLKNETLEEEVRLWKIFVLQKEKKLALKNLNVLSEPSLVNSANVA